MEPRLSCRSYSRSSVRSSEARMLNWWVWSQVSLVIVILMFSQENHWVTFGLTRLGGKDFKVTSAALEELNNHLTFLVGHSATIADITVYGALNANGQAISAIKRNHLPNLVRWFNTSARLRRSLAPWSPSAMPNHILPTEHSSLGAPSVVYRNRIRKILFSYYISANL
jgi:glutathione S-transferase